MKYFIIFSFSLVLLISSSFSWADVPKLINFQGILDSSGTPLANKTVGVEFKIYDDSTAGNILWSETTTVTTNASGLFTVVLGSNNPIPDTTFNDTARWLGVKVGANPEISPRQQLVSVAYSYKVGTVDGATGGKISGDLDIQSQLTVSGKVGVGTLFPQNKLQVEGDSSVTNGDHELLSARSNFASGPAYAGVSLGYRADGSHASGGIVRSLNALPLMLGTINGPTTLVVTDFPYNVGIGTTSPTQKLDVSGIGAIHMLAQTTSPGNVAGVGIANPERSWFLQVRGELGNAFVVRDGGALEYRLLIDTLGNVGIGTITPSSKFNVHDGGIMVTNTPGSIVFSANHTFNRVGVGTGGPEVRFHVIGDGTTSAAFMNGNVGIGTTSPQGSLDVSSTSGGLIVPRMTTTQRNALTPVNGMIIYNTTDNQFNFYENGAWVTK